jgi:hypothetical protein
MRTLSISSTGPSFRASDGRSARLPAGSQSPASSKAPALGLAVVLMIALGVVGCSLQKSKTADGETVKVKTPLGQMKFNATSGAEASDAGLEVYPGARKQSDHGEKGARANVALPFVRVKIVGAEYRCSDPPGSVLAFYRKGLARYGEVKEERGGRTSISMQGFEWHATADQITLSAGQDDNEHLVAVQPEGSGSRFALVYVRAREKDVSATE